MVERQRAAQDDRTRQVKYGESPAERETSTEQSPQDDLRRTYTESSSKTLELYIDSSKLEDEPDDARTKNTLEVTKIKDKPNRYTLADETLEPILDYLLNNTSLNSTSSLEMKPAPSSASQVADSIPCAIAEESQQSVVADRQAVAELLKSFEESDPPKNNVAFNTVLNEVNRCGLDAVFDALSVGKFVMEHLHDEAGTNDPALAKASTAVNATVLTTALSLEPTILFSVAAFKLVEATFGMIKTLFQGDASSSEPTNQDQHRILHKPDHRMVNTTDDLPKKVQRVAFPYSA
ncbi:hypothetical protein KFU94_38095 [Chloroflexi bacterium TSY]|nr:hypothetical protein [Chloroflexi bacterium TSY]